MNHGRIEEGKIHILVRDQGRCFCAAKCDSFRSLKAKLLNNFDESFLGFRDKDTLEQFSVDRPLDEHSLILIEDNCGDSLLGELLRIEI
jgi:hypothetical protein